MGRAALVIAAVALAPSTAAAQREWVRPKPAAILPAPRPLPGNVRRFGPQYLAQPRSLPVHLPIPSVTLATGALVTESEPNDTTTTADLVTLRDTVSGSISPPTDIDFYAIDLTAGTVVDLDVSAAEVGSPLDAVLGLFAPDSVTPLAYNDDWDGPDPRLMFSVETTGRYFVVILAQNSVSGSYALCFGEAALDESEPNDTPAEASATSVGDTVLALMGTPTDVDYFAFDVTEPIVLRARALPYDATFFPISLVLYGSDGTSVLDSAPTVRPYPEAIVTQFLPTAGRYYLAVRQAASGGFTNALYLLLLTGSAPGPGDPATVLAEGLGSSPSSLHALPSGDLVNLDENQDRVLRITPDGTVSEMSNFDGRYANALTVDGYGDVLLAGYDYTSGRTIGTIWQIPASGTEPGSTLVTDATAIFGTTAVGPDGDVWVMACGTVCPELRRYDPLGTLKSARRLDFYPGHLAFAPDGALYATDGGWSVYRIGTAVTTVVNDPSGSLGALAFDKDGYLYVGDGSNDRVQLYSPAFQLVGDPFAQAGLSGPLELAFGRDATGAMTARLFATNGGWDDVSLQGTLVELNPDGIRAPGWPLGTSLLRVANIGLDTATMGAAYADTLRLDAVASDAARWTVVSGALPPGIVLDSASGTLSGVPTASSSFNFVVRVALGDRIGLARFALTVMRPEVALDDAVDVLLGVTGALSQAEQRFLDLQGNQNGRYDIGDLRAWLQYQAAAGDAHAAAWLARLGSGRMGP